MKQCIRAYLIRLCRRLLFAVAMLSVLFVVYGLYGLPWGPAVYASILIVFIGIIYTACDLFGFIRQDKQVQMIKKQAAGYLDMPQTRDYFGQQYREILSAMQTRCLRAEEKAKTAEKQADEYYTLWSHQIKTPIAAMRLLLQEDEADCATMKRELFKVEQYVEMALQYQRLKMDSNDLLLAQYPLDALVKQAIKKVSPLFIHKGISIEVTLPDCRVLTDEKWLVFVIEQLLSNAAKYTKKGRVTITLSSSQPLTLIIEDTGIGILPEDLPRVFEWGYTGYNGRLDKHSTGIGLSLCRQTLAMLGHGITISSVVGKGTIVTLDLSREYIAGE